MVKDFSYSRLTIKNILVLIVILAIMFVIAGRVNYWQGWAFSVSMVIIFSVSSIVFRDKSDLIKERLHPGPGTKWWDKIFWTLYIPLNLAILIIAPLDAGCFRWSISLPVLIYGISYFIFFLSILIGQWAAYVNNWFSSTVRIQKDRGQRVVQEGPYSYVRHPGYAAIIPMYLTMPLILGSLWAMIPALLTIILLIIRTYLEDCTLQKELEGYSDYAKKVKYRLLPKIW